MKLRRVTFYITVTVVQCSVSHAGCDRVYFSYHTSLMAIPIRAGITKSSVPTFQRFSKRVFHSVYIAGILAVIICCTAFVQ